MDQEKMKFPQKLAGSSKVAIVVGPDPADDILLAATILYKYVLSKGKEAVLFSGGAFNDVQKAKLDAEGVNIQDGTNPTSYVVSIDYGKTGLEKVRYDIDEKTGKVNFYLTPTQGEFDFNQVEYRTEGNNFDLTVIIGVDSYSKLGKLYEDSKKLFSDIEVYSILKGEGTLGDQTVNIGEKTSAVYGVRMLLGDQIDSSLATDILTQLVESEPLIEGVPSESLFEQISELIRSGADWSSAITSSYFSKAYVNLDLQVKLMHNLMVDRENRVIWSKVNVEHMKFAGVDRSNLDTDGKIIYNISSEFDLAFAVYEFEKDKLEVVVESNKPSKYSAYGIAAVFGGAGDDRHATFTAENMSVADFESKVFLVLNDMYGVNVYGSSVQFKTGNGDK